MNEMRLYKGLGFVLLCIVCGILLHKFFSEQDEQAIASLRNRIAQKDSLIARQDSMIVRQQNLIDVELKQLWKRLEYVRNN